MNVEDIMKTNCNTTHNEKEPLTHHHSKLTTENFEKFLLDLAKELTKPSPYTLQLGKYIITGTDYSAVIKKWAELYNKKRTKI